MNEALKQWVADHAHTPGLLACGVRASDVFCFSHSVSEKCPPEKMEKILHQLADAQPWLFNDGLTPRWSIWTFEQGQIRIVNRPDGLLFGFVALIGSAAPTLDELSEEFLAAQFGNSD
jgi:hypothetical protein